MSETKTASENQTDERREPTPEELKKHKAELNKFYGEQIPLLKKQAEYEKLLTEIEVAKMTRFEIMMAKAQIMNGPQPGHSDEAGQPEESTEHQRPVNDTEKPMRKLKKEE